MTALVDLGRVHIWAYFRRHMNYLEKIFDSLRSVALTVRERAAMRLYLQAHMRENPLRTSFGSRVSRVVSDRLQALQDSLGSQTFLTHPIYAACVLVLCFGVGTSYAAQSALPGQTLYAIKTRVNEPLQGILAMTPTQKAQWNAELTNRRLEEAEELAATDHLTPVATADIETGLETAIQNFDSNIALISRSDNVQAATRQSDLEASLNAHETVLATLSTSQKKDTSNITSLVHEHAEKVTQERTDTEAALTATDSPDVKTAALAQKKFAQEAITNAKQLSANAFDTQVASSVSAITAEAKNDVQAGETEVKKGKWGKAFGAFQDAIRKMKENEDSVDTRQWLKVRFGIGLNASTSVSTSSPDLQASSTAHSSSSENEGAPNTSD
jgi:hypothetical protein